MKKLALLGAAALMMTAGPALAQVGGTPPSPGGSAGGAGASDRLSMPNREADASPQEMMDRQDQLGNLKNSGKKAAAYRAKLQKFASESAPRRSQALSLREDALAGKPLPQSSGEIRAELVKDMEDWRKEFKIDKAAYEDLRGQIIVEEDALTAAQWADRRAQWFELRDEWIATEMASVGG